MTPTDYTPDRSASPNQRYDALTQAIHWLSLVAVAVAFVIGLLLEDMRRGPGKTQLKNLDALLGVLLLGLTAFRLGWRTLVPAPARPCCNSPERRCT